VDWRVQIFAVGASALTAILFGIAPGVRLAKSDPAEVLRGGRTTAGSAPARVQRTFVVVQMALSVALIIAAGLSISSVARLQRVALGFDPAGVMTFSIAMQGRRYGDPAQRARFVAEVEERLSAIHGVSHVGASSTIPLRPCCLRWNVKMDGVASEPGRPLIFAGGSASVGYFATMGISLIEGRRFATSDDGTAPRVAVVNESFVRQFGQSADVLGRQFDFGFGPTTIVGVVKDVKQGSVVQIPDPYFYWPATQTPTTFMSFLVKTEQENPAHLVASIRQILQQVDPSLPMGTLRSMTSIIDEDTAARRTFKWLLLVFGGIGLTLVAMGIFAVTSFQVSQRLRELAVRLALGATPLRVGAMVFADVAKLAAAGCGIGLVIGALMARSLASTLYGVGWMEPPIYGAAVAMLAVGSLLAAWWPARRAMAAAPVAVLRDA
jgi:predicted permease